MKNEEKIDGRIRALEADIGRLRARLERKEEECRDYWNRLTETEALLKESDERAAEAERKLMGSGGKGFWRWW